MLILFIILIIICLIFKNKKVSKFKENFKGQNIISNLPNDVYKSLFYNTKICSNNLLNQNLKGVFNNFKTINRKELVPIPSKYLKNFDWSNGLMSKEKVERLEKDPYYYNYLGKSIMSPVREQGSCGACYAFATVGVIESSYYLSLKGFGELKELSIQQIIDCTSSDHKVTICDPNKPSKGCGGGDLLNIANIYFTNPQKIAFNSIYPYNCMYVTEKVPPGIIPNSDGSGSIQLTNYDFANADNICNTKVNSLNSYFFDYIVLNPITVIIINDINFLKQSIYRYGPVYVSYYGSCYKDPVMKTPDGEDFFPFKLYGTDLLTDKYITETGLYIGPDSFPDALNFGHAMIITGWGVDKYNKEYWIVKNSWSEYWGYSGYVRFPIYDDNKNIKNIFHEYFAISFTRLCNKCNTMIGLRLMPIYANKLFSIKIVFTAFRENIQNRINFLIKYSFVKNGSVISAIAPAKNISSVVYEPLNDKDGNSVQDDNSYYYNKEGNNFVNNSNGLWFNGKLVISGISNDILPPIKSDKYKWQLILRVLDSDNNVLSQDQLEINWQNLKVL